MHIAAISLNGIRCFAASKIHFSPTVNLLVGENNSGKSTILRAALALQQDTLGIDSIRFGQAQGTITTTVDQPELELFTSQLRKLLANTGASSFDVCHRYDRNPASSGTSISAVGQNAGYENFSNQQPNHFVVTYLAERRTQALSESVSAGAANTVGGNTHHLVAKIDRCCTSRELREQFESACVVVLGFPISTWPSAGGKKAGLEISASRQEYIPLEHMGTGVMQAAGLIAELLVSERKVFLIEELENDLHPRALRALLALIEDSVSRRHNQFIVSTHSNVVLRYLGSLQSSMVIRVDRAIGAIPPCSTAINLDNTPAVRHELLASLGYDLLDYDLHGAWLILEESSAERIIREFLIPWFTPKLSGRLRTIASQGTGDLEPRFRDLHRLFTFIHLEPTYRERAWVMADGDASGLATIAKIRESYKGWPADHFQTFAEPAFEKYYPAEFGSRIADALATTEINARREAKRGLLDEVIIWLRADEGRGRAALESSASDVIARLRIIETAVTRFA